MRETEKYRAVQQSKNNNGPHPEKHNYDNTSFAQSGRNVDIMVPPMFVHQLEADLALVGMSYSLMIPDVQDLIQREKVPTNKV